jgi:nucleotide-binding universal stress UspA family protein
MLPPKMMDEFVDRLRRDHPETPELQSPDTKLVVGLPVTRIVEVAEKTHAQMIVMGSQGRTGISHLLLGSKAEKIAQLAPIPVTIVKNAPPADDPD